MDNRPLVRETPWNDSLPSFDHGRRNGRMSTVTRSRTSLRPVMRSCWSPASKRVTRTDVSPPSSPVMTPQETEWIESNVILHLIDVKRSRTRTPGGSERIVDRGDRRRRRRESGETMSSTKRFRGRRIDLAGGFRSRGSNGCRCGYHFTRSRKEFCVIFSRGSNLLSVHVCTRGFTPHQDSCARSTGASRPGHRFRGIAEEKELPEKSKES